MSLRPYIICSLGFWDGGDEGNEVAGAKEVAEEHDSVGLCFWGLDPLHAWPQHARVTTIFSKNCATVAAHSDTSILQKREKKQ